MTDDIRNYGLFKLHPEARARALTGMGMSEDEYKESLRLQLKRNQRLEELGDKAHGWSKKSPNPGWSDDEIKGEVLPFRDDEPGCA